MLYKYKDWFPELGKRAWVADSAEVIGRVELGDDSSIWFGAIVRGDIHYIKIGKGSNIQDLAVVHVTHYTKTDMSDGFPTIIGDYVTVGHKVMLHGCTIEDYSLIGMNATILDGAVIGKESIVGAGSVVTKGKIFPPRSLIIGSPAKIIRQLTDKEITELHHHSQIYITFKNEYY
jgi:carbonic anhydrase/acetyltransferase-like protein (isoleucine patch superfamily)